MILAHSLLLWNKPPPFRFRNLPHSTTNSRTSASPEPVPERVKLADSLQSDTLKILEWPSLCNQLSAFTSTSMALAAAQSERIPVGQTPTESRRLLDQTSTAVAMPRPLDFSGIEDVSPIVDASVAGNLLMIGVLCSVRRTLRSARSLIEQLEEIASRSSSYVR